MAFAKNTEKASSAKFFYGRITRDEAEIILQERGQSEGMYLLRESISPLGNYAISICHNNKVHHYIIEKQVDGSYMIPEGKPFSGPVELINFYRGNPDGFVTRPLFPCDRLPNQTPVAFRGMTYHDLEKELLNRAQSIKNVRMDKALGPMRDSLIKMVAKDLHLKMPWYHQRISRDEAEKRLNKDKHLDGKFLVRERDDKKSYALTLSYNQAAKHYFINLHAEKYSIEDGPKFECLIMLIDHYHNKQDGLACKLCRPVCCPHYDQKKFKNYIDNSSNNVMYQSINGAAASAQSFDLPPDLPAPSPPPLSKNRKSGRGPLPKPPAEGPSASVLSGKWDDTDAPDSSLPNVHISIDGEGLEDEYVRVRREAKRFKLQPSQISLQDKLGAGQFGSVVKGVCFLGGKEIPVAVKTLKNEDVSSNQKSEIVREAEVMQELDHPNIVRMIGLCQRESIMLVLELAPLGPLNKYLPSHKTTMKQSEVVLLMWQVAKGMAYLEGKKFVHRDLAARNVLMVTGSFAKISDFGMSKALNRDSNYYEAAEAGKWPLKWYAPECIYYFKFDSRSDVWSYGVTLWEAMSFGKKPYYKMKGQEILDFIQSGRRLDKPDTCCDEGYEIMKECWNFEKTHRPSFTQLELKMKGLYESLVAQRM